MPEIEHPPDEFGYDPELGPGYFVQVRSDFLRSGAFSCTAKVLYEVLLTYAGEGTKAWPGQQRLAEHLGVTDRTIRTILKQELIPAGLVSVQRLGLNRTNRYYLHKLPTLPPKVDRKIFPIQERKQFPVQTGTKLRSKAERVSDEVHTGETESEQEDGLTRSPSEDTPAISPPYSPVIAGAILDLARTLHDDLAGPGAVAQALVLWQQSGLSEAAFVAALQAAQGRSRKLAAVLAALDRQMSNEQ